MPNFRGKFTCTDRVLGRLGAHPIGMGHDRRDQVVEAGAARSPGRTSTLARGGQISHGFHHLAPTHPHAHLNVGCDVRRAREAWGFARFWRVSTTPCQAPKEIGVCMTHDFAARRVNGWSSMSCYGAELGKATMAIVARHRGC